MMFNSIRDSFSKLNLKEENLPLSKDGNVGFVLLLEERDLAMEPDEQSTEQTENYSAKEKNEFWRGNEETTP